MDSNRCCGGNSRSSLTPLFDPSKFRTLDSTQEPIFPAKLQVLKIRIAYLIFLLDVVNPQLMGAPQDTVFLGPRVQWYQPTTLKQLLDLRNEFPHTSKKGKPQHRIVVGNTEIGMSSPMVSCSFKTYYVLKGVEVKFKNAFYDVLICPTSIPEMNNMEVTDRGLVVGGAVNLTELSKKLKELVNSIPGSCMLVIFLFPFGIQGEFV